MGDFASSKATVRGVSTQDFSFKNASPFWKSFGRQSTKVTELVCIFLQQIGWAVSALQRLAELASGTIQCAYQQRQGAEWRCLCIRSCGPVSNRERHPWEDTGT